MTFVTHLATFDLTNYATIGTLQNTIVKTMARWKYIDDAIPVYWSQNKLRTKHFNFEIYPNEQKLVDTGITACKCPVSKCPCGQSWRPCFPCGPDGVKSRRSQHLPRTRSCCPLCSHVLSFTNRAGWCPKYQK